MSIAGRIFPTPPALRYVILRHEGIPDPHYDLMFETLPGSPLATWRSSTWPLENAMPLVRLNDHRREYLDYEGPIGEGPVGGDRGRGRVHRVTKGYFSLDRIEEGHWRLTFRDLVASSQVEFMREGVDRWIGRPVRF